jgi:hypothetical protein
MLDRGGAHPCVMAYAMTWLFALVATGGLFALALWQYNVHTELDNRLSRCDATLITSLQHRIEVVTDAPAGSMLVPYVPVQLVELQASQQPASLPQPPAARLIGSGAPDVPDLD